MKNIAFIGFGAFGQALAGVLAKKGSLSFKAWDVQQTGQSCQVSEATEAVKGADVIFFAVPSQFFAQCICGIKGIPESSILVTGTKGMDPETNKLPFEILKECFPNNDVAVLSGPMLADELNAGAQTSATIASDSVEARDQLTELFKGTQVSLVPSEDMTGTALLGVLKNVYTLALGLSDGLKLGEDFKKQLVEKAKAEMMTILGRLGAQPTTIETPAGMGDFLATGYSALSRNYSYGFAFATGEQDDSKTVEGMKNIDNVSARLGDVSGLPFLLAVRAIFKEGAEPQMTLERLN